MTHFATEGLLVSERSGQISSENADQSVAVKFAPTKETTLCQISGALAGQANAEPAETLQAMEITTTEAPASSGNIRWWDLFFIAFNACLGWAIFCFLFSLVAGLLFIAMGYGTDLDAFATAASENFYYTQVSVATFCLALLVAIRRVLRKRRGRGSFVSYFRPIGGRRLLYAALSGLVSYAVGSLLLSVLWSVVHWRYHPPAAEVVPQPYSLGQLAISGLTGVVLAPLTEEIYFRGLLLEWFQQRLALFPSALITAAIFALYHFYFLQYPGIAGWIATAAVAAMGLLCALWAQRTRSLRAPVAAHAAYNAMFVLVTFFGH